MRIGLGGRRRAVLAAGSATLLTGCIPGAGQVIDATRRILEASRRESVTIDDRFADNRNRWPEGEHAHLESGGIRIRPNVPEEPIKVFVTGPGVLRVAADTFNEAVVRWEGGNRTLWYGITTRYLPTTGERYQLVVNAEGRYSFQYWSEEAVDQIIPWRAASSLHAGSEPNVLTLTAKGDTFAISLNGSHVARVTDARLRAPGYTTLIARSGTHILATRYALRKPRERDAAADEPSFVLRDALKDNRGKWMERDPEGFTGTFGLGGYQVVTDYDPDGNEWWTEPVGAPKARDVSVSAEVEVTGRRHTDSFCGIALRSIDLGEQGYHMLLDGGGKFAVRKAHPRFRTPRLIVPWTESSHLRAGSNVIRLTARGDDVEAEINGNRVAAVKDSDLPEAGTTHLIASDGMRITFRNFEAREAPLSQAAGPTATTSAPKK